MAGASSAHEPKYNWRCAQAVRRAFSVASGRARMYEAHTWKSQAAFMRILLVEDEPDLGAAVQEHVRQAGHAVDWFPRLKLADAAMRTVSYDALLLDLVLPDGRGLDFLRALRAGR